MKKIITLAIALVAIVSQAASIDWKVSSTRNTFLFDNNGEKYNGTAYLVLASDVAGLTEGTFADLQSGIATKALDSVTLSNGGYTVDQRTATSDSLVRGTEYAFQLLLIDTATQMYAVSSTSSKVAYSAADGDDAVWVPFGASNVGAARTAETATTVWNSLGGGDTPVVPEPATSALALAGLALLFRRRRA